MTALAGRAPACESLTDYFKRQGIDLDGFTLAPVDPFNLRTDKAMTRAEWTTDENARRDASDLETEDFLKKVWAVEDRENEESAALVALDPDVPRLRDRLKVSTVVGGHVPLKRQSHELVGLCPFCVEDELTFTVNDDEGSYSCSACGAGGDLFTFAERHLGMNFQTAKVEVERAIKVADKATLTRLTALPALEYDRARKDEAAAMGCRASMLDHLVSTLRQAAEPTTGGGLALKPPEPWPDPVDGAAALGDIRAALGRYIFAAPEALDAVTLWVMFTHSHNCFQTSPLLGITSPSPACGKSTLLSLVGALVPKPLPGSNITAAATFRAIEKWEPTLLVDEADTFLRDNDELRGVLNSGHLRASAFVIRTVGDNHEPRQFKTWCAKAIALIGKLPATLASRAVHIQLARATQVEAKEPLRIDRLDLTDLLRQAARWAADNADLLKAADPDLPVRLHGRPADNWRPLIAIGDAAGGEWPQRARATALALAGHDVGETRAIELLADIRRVFAARAVDRITSGALVNALVDMEDRPWPEWRRGKPITAVGVARLLAPFGIKPTQWKTGDGRGRGYAKSYLENSFSRYLDNRAGTAGTALKYKENSEYRAGTGNKLVPDGKCENINENNVVPAVPDGIPGEGGKTSFSAESAELLGRVARDNTTDGDSGDERFNWEAGE